MASRRPLREDGIRRLHHAVPAVVVHEREGFALDRLDYAAHIRRGGLLERCRRDHARKRLGHEHAVRPRRLERLGVGDEEGCRLFEKRVDHLRLVHEEEHHLVHVREASGKRERADHPAEDGLADVHRLHLRDGRDGHGAASGIRRRHDEFRYGVLVADELSRHDRHLVVAEAHVRAERLGLDGKVHRTQHGIDRQVACDPGHRLGLEVGGLHELAHCVAELPHDREGKNRHELHLLISLKLFS